MQARLLRTIVSDDDDEVQHFCETIVGADTMVCRTQWGERNGL